MSNTNPRIGSTPEKFEAGSVVVRGSAAGFAQEIIAGAGTG